MFETWAIPFAALLLSTAGFIISVYGLRHTVRRDTIRDLQDRVAHLERALEQCEQARMVLKEENLMLLRRLQFPA